MKYSIDELKNHQLEIKPSQIYPEKYSIVNCKKCNECGYLEYGWVIFFGKIMCNENS